MFHIILKFILIVSISLNIQGEKNYKQYMKLRASPYVLRIYAGKRKDPIEESYSELLLFTAWRDERTTFGNDEEDFRDMIRVMFLREGEELTDINEDILRNTPKKGYEVSSHFVLIWNEVTSHFVPYFTGNGALQVLEST